MKSMPLRRHPPAGFMHKLSTAVPQSSTLTASCDPPNGCPLDSSAYCTSTPAGSDPQPGGPRAPCHRGACGTSLRKPMHNPGYLLDLPSQDPSANAMVFLGRDTKQKSDGQKTREHEN